MEQNQSPLSGLSFSNASSYKCVRRTLILMEGPSLKLLSSYQLALFSLKLYMKNKIKLLLL